MASHHQVVDTIDERRGSWIKVQYQNLEGFVFDPYVVPSRWQVPTVPIDPAYALLMPICSCLPNFQYSPDKMWKGVYAEDSTYVMKEVKFSYHRQKAEIGEEVCISTAEEEQPLFIIGSNYMLDVNGGQYSRPYNNFDGFDEQLPISRNFSFEEDFINFSYCYENRDIELNEGETYPQSIVWRGDINSDQVDDFIIEYGVKMSKLVLVISERKKGEVVFNRVAEYYHGYCC